MKKIALVTGASRGIGREAALRLAASGYGLVLTAYKNKTELDKTAKEARMLCADRPVYTALCDVSSPDAVQDLFDELSSLKMTEDISLLVNNAGISSFELIQDISDEQWHHVIDVNLTGAFYMCRGVVPYMIKRKSGRIINISSYWGEAGSSMESAYCASKGGLNAFTLSLAKELEPSKITVCALSCEYIDTDMNAAFTKDEIAEILKTMPSGRVISPSEAAAMICLLADPSFPAEGRIYSMNELLKII